MSGATLLMLLQISGAAAYEDRTYTPTGFTAGPYPFAPIREAEVDLVRAGDGFILASTVTSATGAFSFPDIADGESVFARIYSRRAGASIRVEVRDNPISGALYAGATASIVTAAGPDSFPPLNLSITGGGGAVFNIFDAAVKSFQYMATVDVTPPGVMPLLRIYWEPGSANGTYFSPGENAVYLLGLASDPDEFDDDVILHEIGHWVAVNFSRDDTPGGLHAIVDQLDPRHSWSEGWAHYWSSAVRRHANTIFPGAYFPDTQVDNFGSGSSMFSLEGPSFPALAVMATNELAVAAALWDITDTVNEAFDLLSGNEIDLWEAVADRMPAMADLTLEDFRAGLALEVAPAVLFDATGDDATLRIMNDRLIRYYADGSEANDTPGAAAPLALGPAGLARRTFFGAGDEDWFSIAATKGSLRVQTLNMGDGGNTLLEVYGPTGALVASSDNRSPGDPSSLVDFAVAAAATYRARIVRVGTVVQHGYYDIRAEVAPNALPVIGPIALSAASGIAPLKVTLSADASDPDGGYLEYAWDFDGDGRVDWSSLQGSAVTHTYDRAGSFSATLRVTDLLADTTTASIAIVVLADATPLITLAQSSTGGTAPHAVSFSASVSEVLPTAWLWDFDGDGVTDRLSPSGSFVYRSAGSFTARLVVRDTHGRAHLAASLPITVASGAGPPAIGSFTADSGPIPYVSTAVVAHSDAGSIARVELDLDGDGRYEIDMAPSTPASTTVLHEMRRAGAFTLRVRVTDDSGLATEAATSIVATALGTRGWLVDPRPGDRLDGAAVTLTAEAVPRGLSKAVRFEFRRTAPPGPWTEIATLFTTETLASIPWDVRLLPAVAHELRVEVDGSTSPPAAIFIDPASPDIVEEGGVRRRLFDPARTALTRNGSGALVEIPAGALASPKILRLESVGAPLPDGSALAMTPRGPAWRLSIDASFTTPFRLRLPFHDRGARLEIHAYDEASRSWRRFGFPDVSHADGWLEAEVDAPGTYGAFESWVGVDSDGGNPRCLAHSGAAAWPAILLLGMLLCRKR